MNTKNESNSIEIQDQRTRFCDRFGFTGLLCLAFFAVFVAMIELGGKF